MQPLIIFMLSLILIAAFFDLTRKRQPAPPPRPRQKKQAKPTKPQTGQIEIEIALRQMIAKEFERRQG